MATRSELSLRARITLGTLALTAVLSTLFAVWIVFAGERLEHQLLEDVMRVELVEFAAKSRRQAGTESLRPHALVLHADGIGPGVPAALLALGPGVHDDVVLGDRTYRVLRDDVDGRPVAVTYDITRFEHHEMVTVAVLAFGVVLICVAATALAYGLAAAQLRPVSRLADAVQSMQLDGRGAPIASRFGGTELERIARAFDRFMTRVDGFIERERAFTGTASHELRTPLAVIRGAAEIAAAEPALPERARQAIARIQRAQCEMQENVEALLSLARERKALPDPGGGVDLAELAPSIVDNHRHLLGDRPVEVRIVHEGRLHVAAPASVVAMVVGNLIRNAMCYTLSGHIDMILRDRTVVIRDTGPGISPEKLKQLFEPASAGGMDGAGLGLRIAQSICDRYGWSMALESGEGGTTARVRF